MDIYEIWDLTNKQWGIFQENIDRMQDLTATWKQNSPKFEKQIGKENDIRDSDERSRDVDSNEKEAGVQDQDPPFQTLYWVWPNPIKIHKSLDRCYATISISLILSVFYLDLK